MTEETWAQAAANVSSHQRDFVIEIFKEPRKKDRPMTRGELFDVAIKASRDEWRKDHPETRTLEECSPEEQADQRRCAGAAVDAILAIVGAEAVRVAKGAWLTANFGEIADAEYGDHLCEYIAAALRELIGVKP